MRVKAMRDFGGAVRRVRERKRWTQAELASKASVSREWLSAFENGKPGVDAYKMFATITAVGLTIDLQETDDGD